MLNNTNIEVSTDEHTATIFRVGGDLILLKHVIYLSGVISQRATIWTGPIRNVIFRMKNAVFWDVSVWLS
jgi:hypothetical protein